MYEHVRFNNSNTLVRLFYNFTSFKFFSGYTYFLMGFLTVITNLTLFFYYDVILGMPRAMMTSFFSYFDISRKLLALEAGCRTVLNNGSGLSPAQNILAIQGRHDRMC